MSGMNHEGKYSRGYYMPPYECLKWTKKEYIDRAPAWKVSSQYHTTILSYRFPVIR